MTPTQKKRQEILKRRLLRPSLKSKRVPIQAHPYSIEREYTRALIGMCERMNEITKSFLLSGRADAKKSEPFEGVSVRTIEQNIAGAKARIAKEVTTKKAATLAENVAKKTDAFNKRAMTDQFSTVMGVDPFRQGVGKTPKSVIDEFVRENVELIKTIPERYFDELQKLVIESQGKRNQDLAKIIEQRFGVSKSNAERIAVDQVSKLNGQMTEHRQQSLGIQRYTWRTSNDERVRDTHKALEGRTFAWNDPPPEGHPGKPIRCRCRASPIISDLLEGL